MEIAICGKTNTGKSSFFKAATMIDVEISNRIFCTIKPNVGVSFVTSTCPCKSLNIKCTPRNSQCVDGTRMIPVKLWDIAGLIPGAHEGRGLGNQFLNDIIQADMLIHIVDASGSTNEEGLPTTGYDTSNDVRFLENEIDLWFADIIKRHLEKIKDESKASGILAGLGIKDKHVKETMDRIGLDNIEEFARELRKLSKPIIIAANKIDLPWADQNIEKMRKDFPHLTIIPCSAESEIALRTAAKSGFIDYIPGSKDFTVKKELTDKQEKALELIKTNILDKYGSTGIQECLNRAVFEFMKYVAVYPVADVNKFADKSGNVLPDVHLVPYGTTAKEFAEKIHTELAEKFIGAIDARTGKKIGEDHILKHNDIIKILVH